jgi:hypothetical protein
MTCYAAGDDRDRGRPALITTLIFLDGCGAELGARLNKLPAARQEQLEQEFLKSGRR